MTQYSDMLSLPPELIREIIEIVAYDAISQDLAWVATALVLVSRDIRAWVHPILYHTIHIDMHNDEALLRLLDSKPLDFFAPTRHIILVDCFGRTITQRWLANARLPHVETCTVDYGGFLALQTQFIANIRPTRLILTFGAVPGLISARPFAAVTHLRLLLHMDVDWSSRFSKMPGLSHVVFDVVVMILSYAVSILEVNVRAALAVPTCQRVIVQIVDKNINAKEEDADRRFDTVIRALRLFEDSRVYAARVDDQHVWNRTFNGTARTCAREARKDLDPWSIGDRVV
ncbi:hypothetical protein EXIGLDRAFT_719822 [Exidia glandulosa HHB12029]|uniref:F-box domain-containing protein n=1 Tax=Exidia glandulosa HHB12029 TaxID=1314781 RepID=A0A165GTD2_EXIGL|nr:hypothetical protein EXIGLDRAFT_719822 [Exidia glandulosa HHB12029]